MITTDTDPPTERLTADAEQVAAMLGCSAPHVRRPVARGEFPKPLRLGTRVLWSRAVVLAFINGPTMHTAALR
jgi:predicted DNA-binding transcriptional regulator AlpA